METRYYDEMWWGAAEPIYITSLSQSSSLPYTGRVYGISFVDIISRSEASVVIYSEKEPIEDLIFSNITISIEKWSNVSHPCHDYRPCPGNGVPYAPTDGWYVNNVNKIALKGCTTVFKLPQQPYWGKCLNTTQVSNLIQDNFICQQPVMKNKLV